jgi:Ca2+-binding EF-hand superfamily protein
MKKLLIGAAALAFATPAIAQVTPTTPATPGPQAQRSTAAKAHSRADVQAHVAQMFTRLDADRDGFITKAEVGTETASMRSSGQAGERMRQRGGAEGDAFAQIDTNNDGSISRAEFEARAPRKERVAQAEPRERGAQGEPRERGAREGGGMNRMAMMIGGRMFESADADNDGRVSLQEAQAGALAHFDKRDANRDGQITRDERMQKRKRTSTAPSAG